MCIDSDGLIDNWLALMLCIATGISSDKALSKMKVGGYKATKRAAGAANKNINK